METFFGRLKNEVYYGYENEYNSFSEFSTAIKEYRKNKMDATCFVQISIHGIIFFKTKFKRVQKTGYTITTN
ncbi:MAG: IS3 family transposase [Thomasclavelia ramosa]